MELEYEQQGNCEEGKRHEVRVFGLCLAQRECHVTIALLPVTAIYPGNITQTNLRGYRTIRIPRHHSVPWNCHVSRDLTSANDIM